MAFYHHFSSWYQPTKLSSMSLPKKNFSYQRQVPFGQRKNLASTIKNLHPDRIAVLLDIPKDATYATSELTSLLQSKYLVPENMTVGEFYKKLKIQLESKTSTGNWSQRTFFLLSETMKSLTISDTMAEVYEKYKNEDDLLYFYFCEENMFGS